MTKVSICIPTFGQPGHLNNLLDSIFHQSYDEYEIIITDDTRDNSVYDIVTKYNENGKIKYFKNKEILGSPENWNESIRRSEGEFIKIMHHDDLFTYDHSLKDFVNILEKNNYINFVFSATKMIPNSGNNHWYKYPTRVQLKKLSKDPTTLFYKNFIPTPSATFIRKSKVDILFDSNLIWAVDIDYYIKVLIDNDYLYIDKPLITINHNNENQITFQVQNDKNINLYELFYVYEKIYKYNFSDQKYLRKRINKLLKDFKVKTTGEILNAGYVGVIPIFVYLQLLKNNMKYIKWKIW